MEIKRLSSRCFRGPNLHPNGFVHAFSYILPIIFFFFFFQEGGIIKIIIHSKHFLFLKGVSQISLFAFPLTKYNTTLSPGFLDQWFNNLQRAALLTSFWRHRFNNFRRATLLTSLIQYGEDSFQIWRTAARYGELCLWF